MTKKKRYCAECRRPLIYVGAGYWRHYREPFDGHKPSPNQVRDDNNESLKLVGEIVTASMHPQLYIGIKVAEAAADIYKRLKE
jgi:hypothetical protein